MSQNWTTNCYDLDDAGHLDLTNIENNFACLRSMFSGASEPALIRVSGMLWFDTTDKVLRVSNVDNDEWLGVFYGTVNQRCVFYRDDAEEGWIVDTTNTDRLVAVKNHAGGIYTTGGTIAGSWNMTGFSAFSHVHAHSHYHSIMSTEMEGWHQHTVPGGGSCGGPGLVACFHASGHGHTSSTSVANTGGSSSNTVISDSTWRPAACVCTVQYMDI